MRIVFKRLLAATLLAGGMASASAVSYSGITIFGDSLSDTGNILVATDGALPIAPYFAGRFSDGAIWTDFLAGGLGFSATASLMGGQNYAFGGARTGTDASPPGLLAQTGGLWAPSLGGGAADPGRLYVLVGGGNDMRDARTAFQGDTPADEAGRQAAAELAAAQLTQSLGVLALNGAKTVLIGNLPDLGRTPEAVALGLVDASTDVTHRFNALMPSVIAAGSSFGLSMRFVDLAGVANDLFLDATTNGGATFGITNVTTPCGSFLGSVGIACSTSAFSDALHPSTRAHQLLGEAALRAALVPEPQTYALIALGLVAVAWRARRRAG